MVTVKRSKASKHPGLWNPKDQARSACATPGAWAAKGRKGFHIVLPSVPYPVLQAGELM